MSLRCFPMAWCKTSCSSWDFLCSLTQSLVQDILRQLGLYVQSHTKPGTGHPTLVGTFCAVSHEAWYRTSHFRRDFLCSLTESPPKGGRGCLMSPPCLESQGCHLIPLCYLLSCSSAQSCYPFFLIVFCLLALSSKLFPENSSIFFVKRQTFLYGSCLAVRRRQLVGDMC